MELNIAAPTLELCVSLPCFYFSISITIICHTILATVVTVINKIQDAFGGSEVKCLPPMRQTGVQSLGREDPLEKEMVTHSSILAWRIPWTEKPGRLQSTESQRVRHD